MADAKSLRQANGRVGDYMWPTPEQTVEGQAVAFIQSLQSRITDLEGALEPFARVTTEFRHELPDDQRVKVTTAPPIDYKLPIGCKSAELIVSFDGIKIGDFRKARALSSSVGDNAR